MQDEELPTSDDASQPHWCIDCECELLAADQQRTWDFCDFCGQAVCGQCDRNHTCADMLRKKPRNW